MNKTIKIILGALTIWPLLYFGIFTQLILPSVLVNGFEGQNMWTIIFLHFLTFLLCCFLFVYYLIKASTNRDLGEQKTLWILGLIFLNAAAWPVYWYLNIWKKIK